MAVNIIVPRRREDFFDRNGDPTHRFIDWIELVTSQTNSSSVVIESTEQTLTSTGSRVSRNAARINSLELKDFELVNTTTAITTFRNQIIICKNAALINVTLDPKAINGDEVHIKRRDAAIKVIGTIDGSTNKLINIKNFSAHFVFDGIDWSQI